jgi:multiple sugar transport system ATP-binding protein
MARISIRGVSKEYVGTAGTATPVLHNLSLDVADGEFLTLLGPSGCGKSTLIRIVAGLEPQTAGSIEIDGRCVDRLRPSERNLAMVFQSYALYPHMTVADNLALPLRMRRLRSWQRLPWLGRWMPGTRTIHAAIDLEVRESAKSTDLSHLLERKPGQLSGGQRQRVALARAMVRRPIAFLMDEPLSSLDASLRAQMRTEISELHRRLGATFIYVTHDQAEAMTMSSRIAIMIDGRIQQIGTPRDIYEDPGTLQVAQFLGEPRINTFKGVVRPDGAVECLDATIPSRLTLPALSDVTIALRPESLCLASSGLSAIVTRVEYLGSGATVHAKARNGASVVTRVGPGNALCAGDRIRLRPERGVLYFDSKGERLRETAPVGAIRVCS